MNLSAGYIKTSSFFIILWLYT